ncbi:MAG TPA: hypothetical protein PLH38_07715, partial [Clostridia bacterium]|nr:hypothetical protein [Clostridia bacterium]
MTKTLFISPSTSRKADVLKLTDININTYQKSVKDEINSFSRAEFLNIYRDMCYIREFETMLNNIKTRNEYEGIEYNHPGPA